MPFERVLVVGLGAIGGSIISALNKHSPNTTLYGWDTSPDATNAAVSRGWIKQENIYSSDGKEHPQRIEELIRQAELIVIAVPLSALENLLSMLGKHIGLLRDTLLTDTISVKGPVHNIVSRVFADHKINFIGGHPLCGSEVTGIDAANADLFVDQYVVLTPCEGDNSTSMHALSAWWQQLGAHVSEFSPVAHDQIVACTSHLPHLVAYALMDAVNSETDALHLSGGSLRDATRVAGANPQLWTEISMANKDHLLKALTIYISRLEQCADFLRDEDATNLNALYMRARDVKNKLETNKHS